MFDKKYFSVWMHNQPPESYASILKYISKEDSPVLDLGAGEGQAVELLNKLGIEAVGTEVSKFALKEAKKNGRNVIESDFNDGIPFKDNKFGAVVALFVVNYAKDEWNLLKECYRVLRPGGKILIETTNKFDKRRDYGIGRRHVYAPTTLEHDLREVGFEDVTMMAQVKLPLSRYKPVRAAGYGFFKLSPSLFQKYCGPIRAIAVKPKKRPLK
jgi:ubiquinone/menaquinone biosynthesis C-methylase UbiE